MWQKSSSETNGTAPSGGRPDAGASDAREVPIISRSIVIRGEVSGEASLVIRGRVEGNVRLPDKNVFVDPEGRVTGDIHAQIIRVEGRVEGRLAGQQRVVIRSTARVSGDIHSPRVSLEDGCRYRGKIDTRARPADAREPASLLSASGAGANRAVEAPATGNPVHLARVTTGGTKSM